MVRFSRVWRAVVRMGHPQVIRFRQLMRDDGGNTLKSQDNRKGLRMLPLNAIECGKYCPAFQQIIDTAGVKRVPWPPRSPNLNAYAERWVRSIKEECLSRFILFGEASLRHALTHYMEHFHHERNHQGKDNVLLLPTVSQDVERAGPVQRIFPSKKL